MKKKYYKVTFRFRSKEYSDFIKGRKYWSVTYNDDIDRFICVCKGYSYLPISLYHPWFNLIIWIDKQIYKLEKKGEKQ